MQFETTHNGRKTILEVTYEVVEGEGSYFNYLSATEIYTTYKKIKKRKTKYGKTKWRFLEIEVEKEIATKGLELTDEQEQDLKDEFEEIENEKQLYNDPYKFYGLSKSDFL